MTRHFLPAVALAALAAGHWPVPSRGETVRVYLARNAYDGFTEANRDGGFNVIGANGFEPLKAGAGK